jgi:hypothetical protein
VTTVGGCAAALRTQLLCEISCGPSGEVFPSRRITGRRLQSLLQRFFSGKVKLPTPRALELVEVREAL